MNEPLQVETSAAAPPPRRRSALRYLIQTALMFGIGLGLTGLLHEWIGLTKAAAYAISLAVAFFVAFLMFRYYTFDGRTDRPGRQLIAFLIASLIFRVTEWLGFNLLTGVEPFARLDRAYPDSYYLAVIIVVQGTTFVVKYFVYGRWLFRRRADADAISSTHSTERTDVTA